MNLIDRNKIMYTDISDGQVPSGVWISFRDRINEMPIVEAIPVEWLKEHLPKDEDYIRLKGYRDLPEDNLMNIAYDKGFEAGWEAFRKALLEDTINDWEEENGN